jgi:predicted amidophosphoribosyltransferase
VRAARSVCWASGEVGLGVVHALKYQGWYRVGAEMAARMARLDFPDDVTSERRALVPVPLSRKRQSAGTTRPRNSRVSCPGDGRYLYGMKS